MLTARQQATSCLSHVQENNLSLSLLGEKGVGEEEEGAGQDSEACVDTQVSHRQQHPAGGKCVCLFVEAVLGVLGGQEGLSQTAAGCTDEEEEEEDAVRCGGSEGDGAWKRPASKMHYG